MRSRDDPPRRPGTHLPRSKGRLTTATTAHARTTTAGDQALVRDGQTWFAYGMIGFFAFLQAILGPLMPFLRATLGISYATASLHFSAFALGAVLAGVLGDRVARRWARSAVIWGGAAGMLVGVLCLASVLSVIVTIAGALVLGLSGVLLLNAAQANLTDRHPSGVALVEANVYASCCAILSAVAVGTLTAHGIDWRAAFLPALVMLAPLVILARPHRPLRAGAQHPSAVRTAANTSAPHRRLPARYWAFCAAVVLETGVEWIFAYWGASFLVARGSFSQSQAATAMGAFFLAMVVGRGTGSRLLRVMPGRRILVLALAVALLGFPVFWLAPLPAVQVAGLFCVGLGLANVYPVGVGLAAGEAPGLTDRAMARLSIGTGLAVLLAPAILGLLADALGIARAFAVGLPLLIAALAVAAVISSRTEHVTPIAHA